MMALCPSLGWGGCAGWRARLRSSAQIARVPGRRRSCWGRCLRGCDGTMAATRHIAICALPPSIVRPLVSRPPGPVCALSDGALYPSGKILLAKGNMWRLDHSAWALASQGRSSYMAGMAEARSRGPRKVSWRAEITVIDGGEATGRSAFRLRAPPSSSADA